jgi:small subunit ribosomal protein S1
LIHVSQLPKGQQGAKELKDFQVEDELDAEVVNVSQKDKRIGLSIRKLQESPEKKVYTNYVNNQEKATSSLGALLKEKMMDLDSDDHKESVPPTVNE